MTLRHSSLPVHPPRPDKTILTVKVTEMPEIMAIVDELRAENERLRIERDNLRLQAHTAETAHYDVCLQLRLLQRHLEEAPLYERLGDDES